jgi:diaminopimelate decarboxylase
VAGEKEFHPGMVAPQSNRSVRLIEAKAQGLLDGEPPAALFFELDALDSRLDALVRAYPRDTLHCLAMKACPLPALLARGVERGLGLECASAAELALALELCPPERVVFDSPAKTHRELEWALQTGVILHIDSLQELERVIALDPEPSSAVGIRINPSLGMGTIADTSTAVAGSKFGIDLHAHRAAIVDALVQYPWLRGLHVHVGSQGCELDQLVAGARAVDELSQEVAARGKALDWLDLGGGLPVAYRESDTVRTFAELAQVLEHALPRLWSGPSRLITEFGRSIFAPVGWAVSRVESTKCSGGRRIAVIHLGADFLLRPAYRPEQWSHRIRVFDEDGREKLGAQSEWDIAGPLCFSGDLLARSRLLPAITPGDLICIEDAGAYSLSMWSRYNSRRSPAVYGIEAAGQIQLLRAAEQIEQVLDFWR